MVIILILLFTSIKPTKKTHIKLHCIRTVTLILYVSKTSCNYFELHSVQTSFISILIAIALLLQTYIPLVLLNILPKSSDLHNIAPL